MKFIMKFVIIFLSIICLSLTIIAITYIIKLKIIKAKGKRKDTPKLSELHGDKFKKFMDYLSKDL